MTTLPARQRAVLRIGAYLLVAGGALAILLAFAPLTPEARPPQRVRTDGPVELPSSGIFGARRLVLYGRPGNPLPRPAQLGCMVTDGAGEEVGLHVSTTRALGRDQHTIDGQVLEPLAVVHDVESGWLLQCVGEAARSRQPLYLVSDTRSPIPKGPAVTFGVTALVLGTGGIAAFGSSGRLNPV